jgi:predicted O-linked N-acetylglucosamine transferase (SPINDLY family)
MPALAEIWNLAVGQHQAGELAVAQQLYRQILAARPDFAPAWHHLGLIAFQTGQPAAALAHLDQALAIAPEMAAAHYDQGLVLQSLGRLQAAVAAYRRAAELAPDNAAPLNNLGAVLERQGELEAAIACFRRALERQPEFAEAHNNLGAALAQQGLLDEALACYQRAIALAPDYAEAHFNRGTAQRARQDLAEAAESYRRAIALRPNYAAAHSNLGNALCDLGALDAAVASYRRAIEIAPEFAEAHSNLGLALQAAGQVNEAVAAFRRALELRPQFAEAANNLGAALRERGELDAAAACLREALAWRPDYAEAHNNLGTVLKDRGELDAAIAAYRRAIELQPDFASAHSNLLFTLQFRPGSDAAVILQAHQRWNAAHVLPLVRSAGPHSNEPNPDRRLRIGYVSPDFRNHCQAFFTLPLLASHDRERFEIVCYSDVIRPDDLTERLRAHADQWRSIVGLSHEQAAHRIREDQIDILVDLTMHMARGRPLLFARKPAPVQVAWLAYPGTSGNAGIDYRLTDPHLDPPGTSDASYTEASIRLPETFWCYDPLTSQPAVNEPPAERSGCVTFGSLNSFCKLNAGVLRLWAEVLRAVEGSRLLLLAPEGTCRQMPLGVLTEAGVAPERVRFASPRPRPAYLALYHQIDIALDPLPYNGHTTSLDAFWMGVPVVTLVGGTVVGRAGLSQLTNLGLTELIAHSPDEYVAIAVGLAGDARRRSELRASLRERLQKSPLMDARRFARNIEAAYRLVWQRWCARTAFAWTTP